MNVKSLLLAAAVATVSAGAFANNYDNGVEFQVAQASAPSQSRMTSARAATVPSAYQPHNDASSFVATDKNDTRTRAEVRAETIRALNSGEARALRAAYVGGSQ